MTLPSPTPAQTLPSVSRVLPNSLPLGVATCNPAREEGRNRKGEESKLRGAFMAGISASRGINDSCTKQGEKEKKTSVFVSPFALLIKGLPSTGHPYLPFISSVVVLPSYSSDSRRRVPALLPWGDSHFLFNPLRVGTQVRIPSPVNEDLKKKHQRDPPVGSNTVLKGRASRKVRYETQTPGGVGGEREASWV